MNEYSENILVQESAGQLLHDELGWDVATAYNQEVLGENGTFGRKSYRDVLLKRHVRQALRKLNPWMNDTQVEQAISTLETRISTASLMQVNEEKYRLIRDGIDVAVKNSKGEPDTRKAMLINFGEPTENHFLAIKEMKIHGELYRRRTDIVGYVNGLPLLFVELKKNTVEVENAYNDNYMDYLDTIPQLFYYNAIVMLSNGLEAKVGTLGSPWEFFHEWKRLKEEDEGNVELQTMLRGICRKENFIDLLENFILYDHSNGKTAKILARNHQYLGVNEAVKAYAERKLRNGKLGVFWHTQGSGKSYSMLFLAQKIRRRFAGSPTIVVLTDRDELNEQISGTFEGCGLLGSTEAKKYIATSGERLIAMLKDNPSFIFTLIQKFNKPDAGPLYPDYDILVMSDEAHRSQYGYYAENMRRLLPTCSRIGFTGTPLLANDNITERTFGGYISIYDFKRAVDDGATVPLFYENRGERLNIPMMDKDNAELNQRIAEAIEKADLDPTQEAKLEKEFAKEIHLLTAEDRLDKVAKDFVYHYTDIWTSGKAMFVCINKVTCVRMYNLAQKYWTQVIAVTEEKRKHATQQEALELDRKLKWLRETEMCVVVSQEQNEIQTFSKWGLDIEPHRKKMEKRQLDKEFKQADSPFRVVFVCAMWLTGFDVKTLSCLYLDKPLKAHTLMQTIARANRKAEGKSNGLIIDYIGVVKALRKALADYTMQKNGTGGGSPTVDKEELIKRIEKAISLATEFLSQCGFELHKLMDATGFDKLALVREAANAVCETNESRKTFKTYASELANMFKYVNREEMDDLTLRKKNAIIAISGELNKKIKHADNTDLMVELNKIVNDYVQVVPSDENKPAKQFDISKIDFDLLSKEFAKTKAPRLVLNDLEDLVKQRIERMLNNNPTRINFYEKYTEIINSYNSEQDRASIEKTFMELMALSQSLDQEQKRYVREGFESDEELSVYDLLFSDNLSKKDIESIKKVSVNLLKKIKDKIAEFDHWTDKQETKAAIDNLIRDTLWAELPECYDENSITEYRQKIYEYVYTRYKEVA